MLPLCSWRVRLGHCPCCRVPPTCWLRLPPPSLPRPLQLLFGFGCNILSSDQFSAVEENMFYQVRLTHWWLGGSGARFSDGLDDWCPSVCTPGSAGLPGCGAEGGLSTATAERGRQVGVPSHQG